ncbi:MAG: hypothetical protein GY944_09425 [bacterium]|nr:hypothetical protein [bacterium]MCP5041238.1 hypothetical protein [bacterium]
MSEASTQLFGLDRRDVAGSTTQVLHRGNWANPDVLLVETSRGGEVVVKDYTPRSRLVRETYGRWITGREARAYRLLEGSPGVPALMGRLDSLALVIEYRPGTRMSRDLAGRLPEGFMDELRAAVRGMHERGVVHLDLRHRSNVLADADGHPVLIDFASALFLRPGGWLARMLARIDWGAVRKWEVRVTPRIS